MLPSMRDVPGTDPWDVDALTEWANGPAPTSGSRGTARFLLGVWNPGADWTEYGLIAPGRFAVFDAWSCWDEPHRRAVLVGLEAPFWP